MNVHKAMAYVQEHGDALARARAEVLMKMAPPLSTVAARLAEVQREDGGWPADLDETLPSSTGGTCAILLALQDLGLQGQPMAQRGLQFLLTHQEEDGGWSGRTYPLPPQFGEEAGEAGRICLAALVGSVLAAYGQGKGPAASTILDFLLRHQQEDGLFAGFSRHTAWYALPILALNLGQRSGPAQNILSSLTRELGERDWFPSMFAALLRNLLLAGYNMETPLVRHVWEQLLMRQREDGAWPSEAGEPDTVRSTLEVLWCWKQITNW